MTPFRKYPSALRQEILEWAAKTGEVDILIGIPTFNNENTIKHVVEMVAEGLARYFSSHKTAILISDGGSLDDTRENALAAAIPAGINREVTIYRGLPGKGTSFRAVFELAVRLNAAACAVLDADLRSITPEWVHRLITPVLNREADFVAPLYQRHKFDGTITNHIVYPLTRALYGKDIRQPIGGDFGFSGELARIYIERDVWMTDVAKFGIDIWMTTTALVEKGHIVQADLGVKNHDPKDPAADLGPMFHQVVSTLLYMMGKYEARWKAIPCCETVPTFGDSLPEGQVPAVDVSFSKLEEEFVDGFEHFLPLYEMVTAPANFSRLRECYQDAKKGKNWFLNAQQWSRIVYDFAFTFQGWRRNRRRLVDILTPLYFGRVGSYCREVDNLSTEAAEKVIQKQAKIFEKNKSYLIEKYRVWEK